MCYDDDGFDHDDDDDGNNKVCLNIGSYDVWWFQLLLMTMMIVGWYMDLDIGIVNPIILLQLIGFDFSFIILIKFILSYHFFSSSILIFLFLSFQNYITVFFVCSVIGYTEANEPSIQFFFVNEFFSIWNSFYFLQFYLCFWIIADKTK